MRYQAVACKGCRHAWLTESRHATTTCPRCRHRYDVGSRRVLWQGDDARAGQAALAGIQAGLHGDEASAAVAADKPAPHHDDAVQAAAAKARAVRNASQRADIVALWLTRLEGQATHDQYLAAMQAAGLSHERAAKELIRMLAHDVIYEPAPGRYQALAA